MLLRRTKGPVKVYFQVQLASCLYFFLLERHTAPDEYRVGWTCLMLAMVLASVEVIRELKTPWVFWLIGLAFALAVGYVAHSGFTHHPTVDTYLGLGVSLGALGTVLGLSLILTPDWLLYGSLALLWGILGLFWIEYLLNPPWWGKADWVGPVFFYSVCFYWLAWKWNPLQVISV